MLNSSSPSLAVERLRAGSMNQGLIGQPPISSDSNGNGNTGGNGGVDGVFDTVNSGLDVYDRLRCMLNPRAPGCNDPDPVVVQQQQETQRVWLYLGIGVIVLLVLVILLIALKK